MLIHDLQGNVEHNVSVGLIIDYGTHPWTKRGMYTVALLGKNIDRYLYHAPASVLKALTSEEEFLRLYDEDPLLPADADGIEFGPAIEKET